MTAIPCAVFDLDSTVADTFHRQWMVEEITTKPKFPGQKTWDDYSMECAKDTPMAGTVTLMRLLSAEAGLLIFIVTGRSSRAKTITRHWLLQNHIPCDALLMRPEGDRTPNGEYKVAMIEKMRSLGYEPVIAFEDWAECGDYITKETGVPVVLVNPNYPDRPLLNENRGV